mmetsp:Transcript_19136/g.48632  ORF Transcript_19136/g.48632 Transcript_19136/m.48632 type:complete len:240 (-) Transcript_19136:873-1592(-)
MCAILTSTHHGVIHDLLCALCGLSRNVPIEEWIAHTKDRTIRYAIRTDHLDKFPGLGHWMFDSKEWIDHLFGSTFLRRACGLSNAHRRDRGTGLFTQKVQQTECTAALQRATGDLRRDDMARLLEELTVVCTSRGMRRAAVRAGRAGGRANTFAGPPASTTAQRIALTEQRVLHYVHVLDQRGGCALERADRAAKTSSPRTRLAARRRTRRQRSTGRDSTAVLAPKRRVCRVCAQATRA